MMRSRRAIMTVAEELAGSVGSADFLEALGCKINLSGDQVTPLPNARHVASSPHTRLPQPDARNSKCSPPGGWRVLGGVIARWLAA